MTIVVYIAIYCIQTFVSGVDPVSLRTALGAACIIVATVTLYLNTESKVAALYTARRTVYESGSKKIIFDDISPVSNDREKLFNGTKQEQIKICQDHLMLWSKMLADVSNSELRSSHENNDENRSGNKQSSRAAVKNAIKSNIGSQYIQESHGQVNHSRAGVSEN